MYSSMVSPLVGAFHPKFAREGVCYNGKLFTISFEMFYLQYIKLADY